MKKDEQVAISAKGVCLDIPIYTSETKRLKKSLVKALTGGNLERIRGGALVHALKGIDAKVYYGERIGIIGHNGSGKSTFLRVISNIYQPSAGSITRNCKVHAMIEKSFVTGPELSGAEAVKGQYLLSHGDLRGFEDYLEDVVRFSELGDYIRMPLKGYSEGMCARLVFAMMTTGSHDCLVMDEGFGTGDSRFYEKARIRLERFIASAGTLVLASHSEELLKSFCQRGIVFKEGRIVYDGQLESAIKFYHEQPF
jgi:ABC-type polysaccharide/polyol phosphate transport system ATPase subunit